MANNYSFQEPVEDLQRQEEKNRVQKELSKTEKKQTRVIERSTKYQLTLEPAIFLSTLADYLQMNIISKLYLDKVCLVNFGLNASICDAKNQVINNGSSHLQNSSDNVTSMAMLSDTDQVQHYVSTLKIYESLLNTIPAIIFALVLGPWSEKHGRKPLMIAPTIGFLMSIVIYATVHYVEFCPAEFLLLAGFSYSLLGGLGTFELAYNSYLVDITTEDARTFRISVFNGITLLARPIGFLSSSYIFIYGGYLAIWCTSAICSLLSLLYIIFFVTDSRANINGTLLSANARDIRILCTNCISSLKAIWRNFQSCFLVTFRPRAGNRRAIVLITLLMMCFIIFSDSPFSITTLYTRKKFGWDAPEWGFYRTIFSSVYAFGSLVVIPIVSGYFKISDGVIGIVCIMGDVGYCIFLTLAVTPLMFYLCSIFLLPSMGIETVMISVISKQIEDGEMSHVYAVATFCKAVIPLLMSPMVNLLYKATLETFPAAIFLFGMSLDWLAIALLSIALVLHKQQNGSGLSTANEPPEKDEEIDGSDHTENNSGYQMSMIQ